VLTGAGGAALGVAATSAQQREPGPFETRELDLGSADHVLNEIGAAGHLVVDINGGELIHVVTWDPSYPYNDITAEAHMHTPVAGGVRFDLPPDRLRWVGERRA